MTDCFWTDLVDCSDPDCGGSSGTLYSYPAVLWDSGGGIGGEPANFNAGLFSDIGLTMPVTATTASVTQVKVYEATSFGNCDFVCWISCVINDSFMTSNCVPSCPNGSDPTAPPIGSLLATYTPSITFDPAGLVPTSSIIAAAPVIDGVTHDINNVVLAVSVHTDIGDALYIFGGSTCF